MRPSKHGLAQGSSALALLQVCDVQDLSCDVQDVFRRSGGSPNITEQWKTPENTMTCDVQDLFCDIQDVFTRSGGSPNITDQWETEGKCHVL